MGSIAVIEGNECLMRRLTTEDLDQFSVLVTAPLYGKFSPFGKMSQEFAIKSAKLIISNYQLDRYEFLVVIDKKDKTIAGFVGYHPVMFNKSLQYMFFVGFHTKYWGTNIPEQATQMASHYAFNTLSRLILFVHPDDTTALMTAQCIEARFEREALYFGAKLFLFVLERPSSALVQ
jgi:RimJ/RimL family protein N-acetyltransferase